MSSSLPESEVTRVLKAAAAGDKQASASLLPLVYDELRRVARSRLSRTPPGDTLQPTALVHEAYLKLLGDHDPGWDGRHHFFGAAAQAMRDIVVDHSRRKAALKHGGGREREDFDVSVPEISYHRTPEDILALNEALVRLEAEDPRKAQLVMLRCFAGLSQAEVAAALDLSERTIEREWRYIKAWLLCELNAGTENA